MNFDSKIFVAGHNGLVGSSLVRKLKEFNYTNIISIDRAKFDLTDQQSTFDFFSDHKPEYVFDAAAKVGGIYANSTFPADFIYDNLCIQNSLIYAAYKFNVKKFCFFGSSCIYPKFAPQPIEESSLLTGPLKPTNDAYALAKIAGIKLCQSFNKQYNTNFFSVMPTNLYGPGDNFDPMTSHVLPAIIYKTYFAKLNSTDLKLWGTGNAFREFLYVDDLAEASILLMNSDLKYDIYNIGYGTDLPIRDLVKIITKEIGFKGKVLFDDSKPDGTPKKLLNSNRIRLIGWTPKISIENGIKMMVNEFIKSQL